MVYSDNFVTLLKGVCTYFEPVNKFCGACSGTALQARRSRVRFLMWSLEFFIDMILPTTLWPWGQFRNEYQEYFLRG